MAFGGDIPRDEVDLWIPQVLLQMAVYEKLATFFLKLENILLSQICKQVQSQL